MKFRATVTEFIGEPRRPQTKRLTQQTIIALAVDDSRVVIVLKPEKKKSYHVIQLKDVRSFHKAFISEGKATLCLDSSSFFIKSQPTEMRRFAAVVDSCLKTGRVDKHFSFPNLDSVDLKVPKKNCDFLYIKSAAQLPSAEGYPRDLTCLAIENVVLNEFDHRILRLQHLRTLTLDAVGLKTIPKQIELLVNLNTLNLADNLLGLSSDWRWARCSTLQKKLIRLDLSGNRMTYVPTDVCRLSALQKLTLSNNLLKSLPNAIRLMKTLRELLLKENEIEYFPLNITVLTLKTIDYSSSRTEFDPELLKKYQGLKDVVPKLLDLAATVVVNQRLEYSEEMIPSDLCYYLDNAIECLCTKFVFPPTPTEFICSSRSLAGEIHYNQNMPVFHIGYRPCVVADCSYRTQRRL